MGEAAIAERGKQRAGRVGKTRLLYRPWAWPLWLLRKLRPPRRLRLTREGRYFIAITIGIGLAAINTGNNLLYLILGWLLSLIIASGALSDVSMRGLRVLRRPPGRIFAGRPFLMEISVENQKGKLASYSVEIEDLVDDKPLDKKCYFLKVPAGRTQRTSYRHTFARRGLYRFGGFRISTKFPFALFHKSRRVSEPGDVLVYPSIVPVRPPPPKARNLGETASRRVGRHGEFFGLREYRDGDDRRSIHWRSTARSGRLLVREYEEEAQRRATIMVDNALPTDAEGGRTREHEDALEKAISLAASLASHYIHMTYAVRLVTRGAQVRFGSGEAQLTRVLRELALLETATEDTPFTGEPAPAGENVLVVPAGVPATDGRPTRSVQLMEGAP